MMPISDSPAWFSDVISQAEACEIAGINSAQMTYRRRLGVAPAHVVLPSGIPVFSRRLVAAWVAAGNAPGVDSNGKVPPARRGNKTGLPPLKQRCQESSPHDAATFAA